MSLSNLLQGNILLYKLENFCMPRKGKAKEKDVNGAIIIPECRA